MTEGYKTTLQSHEALLSSADGFTAFSYGGYNIRFRAPYSLERYVDVVKWDDGYLVVLAKYSHNAEPEEEYIDLKPILDDLYIDPETFLKPIKKVRIAYVWYQGSLSGDVPPLVAEKIRKDQVTVLWSLVVLHM